MAKGAVVPHVTDISEQSQSIYTPIKNKTGKRTHVGGHHDGGKHATNSVAHETGENGGDAFFLQPMPLAHPNVRGIKRRDFVVDRGQRGCVRLEHGVYPCKGGVVHQGSAVVGGWWVVGG